MAAGDSCLAKDADAFRGGSDFQSVSCSCFEAILDQIEILIKDCYLSLPLSCVCEQRDYVRSGGMGTSCPTMRTC